MRERCRKRDMRLLLLPVVAYATLPSLATSAQADDLAMQQRSLSRHSAETLLLNEPTDQ
jgi:hypothetical protein